MFMSHAIATASQVQLVEYLLALVLRALNIVSPCWITKLRRHKLRHKLCCAVHMEGCWRGVYDLQMTVFSLRLQQRCCCCQKGAITFVACT